LFESRLRDLKEAVDLEMQEYFKNAWTRGVESENLGLLRDYCMMGGKRLRPAAMIAAYMSYGGLLKEIVKPSLSVEFLHTSTLIFDDLMDEDDYRRGNPGIQLRLKQSFKDDSCYEGNIFSHKSKRYAASRAMLIGLFSEILGREMLLGSSHDSDKRLRAVQAFETAYRDLVYGQSIDIENEGKETTEEEYLEMVRGKTSSIFAASMEIGAILAGANPSCCINLREYGQRIAMAFQIQDDIMDIGESKGHRRGSDILKGKRTLLVIKGMQQGTEEQKSAITNVLGNEAAADEDLHSAITAIKESGAEEYCRLKADNLIRESDDFLTASGADAEFFRDFGKYMLERKT